MMKFRKWEIALIMSVLLTFLFGLGLAQEQRELSEKLIRLHVVANSDSEEDQYIKLCVRDAVTSYLEPRLSGVSDSAEARVVIESSLEELISEAQSELESQGVSGVEVTARLTREMFPTREYETFTLPAGKYEALRIELGEAAGQNWWCVVFPPLCGAGTIESIPAAWSLTPEEVALITDESEGYAVKFKAFELLSKLGNLLGL